MIRNVASKSLPLERRETLRGKVMSDVKELLKAEILRGELTPGTVLSQVQLSKKFGVSRTPMREALRMLEEDGLILSEPNRRPRVAAFDAEHLEVVYTSRILLMAAATAVTVPRMVAADFARLKTAFKEMRLASDGNDLVRWNRADAEFHRVHTLYAPGHLLAELDRLHQRSALYILLMTRNDPHLQANTVREHEVILDACLRQDQDSATKGIARHLARIALQLMPTVALERDPMTIRSALQTVLGELSAGPGAGRTRPAIVSPIP